MIKTNLFKKKNLIWALTLLLLLPCAILLSACGKKNYSVNITVDGQYLYLDMFGSGNISFKKNDLKNSGLNLHGYDVYDYSELKVLINGKENNELFSKNDNSGSMYNSQIRGETLQIGTFMLSNIKEDITITITGAKEKEVSLAFMRADDERLGEDKLELTSLDQSTFNNNYDRYIQNYSTKLKERDYQNLDAYYQTDNIASSTTNGYTSVEWLFKDNKNAILYEGENEENTLYKPYEFKYNASEFFNKQTVTYYTYVAPNGAISSGYSSSQLENLPSGTKEYKYQAYAFTNGDFYDNYAIFEILSDKKYGYYDGVEIKNYEYDFDNYGSYEGILDSYGKIVADPYKPLNKENITVEQLRKQSNYVFELYEKNLFVFDFSNMNVKEKNIIISHINASLSTDFNGSIGSSLDSIEKVDTKTTFYILNLPNKLSGVSGIDFSNAEILINGTKLEGFLGGYNYIPANKETGIEEHFECYINAGIVEVDFYSKERLLDNDLSLNNDKEQFEITIKNIDFDHATGLSKIKATDYTNFNIPYISSYIVYEWNEGYTAYAYIQTEDIGNFNNYIIEFSPNLGFDFTKTPIITVKKGNEIKEIDIMAQINQGLTNPGSLENWKDEQENDYSYRYLSWSEDGYEIIIGFYNPEISIQTISTISIKAQLDPNYTDWLEINCNLV